MSVSRAPHRGLKPALLAAASAYVLAAAVALGAGCFSAAAAAKSKPKPKESHQVGKDPFGDIPKGPLHIIISIGQQRLHLYSNGVRIADAPISTGVPGHPTPMGVFSVIEKDRYHQSNIYSGAPMPYMQRITWSGVAIHEGPLPGGPASHGCIRMPRDFAARLWVLTRLGARVIIARTEVAPVAFSDPRLFVRKELAAGAVAAAVPWPVKTAQATDPTRATDAPPPLPTTTAPALAPPAVARALAAAGRRSVIAAAGAVEAAETTGALDPAPLAIGRQVAAGAAAGREAAGPPPAAGGEDTTGSVLLRGTLLMPPAVVEALRSVAPLVPVAPPVALPAASPPAPQIAATDTDRAELPQDPATVIAPAEVTLPPPRPDVAKILAERAGPVAVFVSRKEGKVFVRQRFAPVFSAPVTIADPARPLGTHVFTAMAYLDDGPGFRWTAVTLPGEAPKTERHGKTDPGARNEAGARSKHKAEHHKPAVDAASPQTAHEALARITLPPDAIDRISAMMVPGSSLTVSDSGLGPETGEGTEFIVLTR